MIAYKAFGPGLVCRNYQFEKGRNVTDKAKCAAGGFHCAEDPLDCLCYYQWNGKNEFWIVEAGGDIDEDGVDTRISCTELTTLAKLDEERYLMAAVPFPVSWTVKMKKKQKETQDILSYHTQAAGCSDKARAKASGGRQPIEECGRTGL